MATCDLDVHVVVDGDAAGQDRDAKTGRNLNDVPALRNTQRQRFRGGLILRTYLPKFGRGVLTLIFCERPDVIHHIPDLFGLHPLFFSRHFSFAVCDDGVNVPVRHVL